MNALDRRSMNADLIALALASLIDPALSYAEVTPNSLAVLTSMTRDEVESALGSLDLSGQWIVVLSGLDTYHCYPVVDPNLLLSALTDGNEVGQ